MMAQVREDREGNGLTCRTFSRCPFSGVVKDPLEEGDKHAFALLRGDVGEEAWVVEAGLDGVRGGRPDVALDGLHVGLGCPLNAVALGYFLCVRREDLTRFLGRGEGECKVVEAPVRAPAGEVVGASRCSASVAFSSWAPVGGNDTSQSRCKSRAEGVW